MRYGEALGFHGIVLPSRDLEGDARRWGAALGFPVFQKTARAIVLGYGPHLFVTLVKSGSGNRARPVELHLAVHELRDRGRRKDPLGGESVSRSLGKARLIVREFRRPPSGQWRVRPKGRTRRSKRSG